MASVAPSVSPFSDINLDKLKPHLTPELSRAAKRRRLGRIVRAQGYRTFVSLTFFFSPRLGRHISIR